MMRQVCQKLVLEKDFRLCGVFCIDSTFIKDAAKFVSANDEWIYAIAKETTEGCAECAWSCERPCPADGSGWRKSGVSEPLRYVHVGVLQVWAIGITGGLLHKRLDAPLDERWTTQFDAYKRFVSIASNEWYVFGTTTVRWCKLNSFDPWL